jgi:bifunctional non-homologous end joining protein LigD
VAFQRRKPAAIGVKVPFSGFIGPPLATSSQKVPSGSRWIHEIKFDGYRVQVHLANELHGDDGSLSGGPANRESERSRSSK